MSATPFTVVTQHGPDRKVRRRRFADFDAALAAAESTTPDTDDRMAPNVDESYGSRKDYEMGIFWFGNRYAVILNKALR